MFHLKLQIILIIPIPLRYITTCGKFKKIIIKSMKGHLTEQLRHHCSRGDVLAAATLIWWIKIFFLSLKQKKMPASVWQMVKFIWTFSIHTRPFYITIPKRPREIEAGSIKQWKFCIISLARFYGEGAGDGSSDKNMSLMCFARSNRWSDWVSINILIS